MCGRSPIVQKIDDAAARSITTHDVLGQMELWVRGQLRRGNITQREADSVLEDIDLVRAQVAAHRGELSTLRTEGAALLAELAR